MRSRRELTLYEQLVLVAGDTSRGPGDFRTKSKHLDLGVAGAVLFLLLRGGRVTFQRGRFHVRGQLSLGDGELDKLLMNLMNKADPFKAMRANKWLRRAARAKPQDTVISGLIAKGFLAREDRKLTLLRPEAREEIVERLRAAVQDQERADEKTAALAGLAYAAQCLGKREFRDELKRQKTHLNAFGKHTGPVIPAVRAAVADRKFRASLLQGLLAALGIVVTLFFRYCSS